MLIKCSIELVLHRRKFFKTMVHTFADQTNLSLDSDSATTPSWNPGVVSGIAENDSQITGNHTSTSMSDYAAWLYRIDPYILLYSTVIIALLGIIGNSFSIAVLTSSLKFRRSSTVQFLITLAVTDSIYLIGELLYVTSLTNYYGMYISSISFVNTSDIGCKLVMWLRYRLVSYIGHVIPAVYERPFTQPVRPQYLQSTAPKCQLIVLTAR